MSSRQIVVYKSKKGRKGRSSSRSSKSRGSGPAFKPGGRISTTSFAFPQHLTARLGYNEQFSALPTAGGSDGYVIALQGPYDPRFAAGGHQPQYFDQLAALYIYHIVRRVKLSLSASPLAITSTAGTTSASSTFESIAFVVPFVSTSGTRPSTAASDMLEWAGGIRRPITPSMPAVVSVIIDLPRMLGIPWPIYRANPAFWGTNGGVPTGSNCYGWGGCIGASSGTPDAVLCQLTVEYEVEFFLPASLATS
jgi:hypothetical protein